MSEQVQAYPLQWPSGIERTALSRRERARFKHGGNTITLHQAAARLYTEFDRVGAASVVVSTNVELRLDGQPRGGRPAPKDPGVAVYWMQKGDRRCIPCDRWDRVADNVAAIAKAIEALRGLDRWVNASVVEAAFTGFNALPPPRIDGERHWREVLKFSDGEVVNLATIDQHYRVAASLAHPDREGGSAAEMTAVNLARQAAITEVSA